MSGHDPRRRKTTTVSTTTQVSPTSPGPDFDVLTSEEEKVLRMLHGLSEEGPHPLKFALGADADSLAKLAMMEKQLVELFRGDTMDESLMGDVQALRRTLPDGTSER